MRALTATALTFAFLGMAAVTYLAVEGDPMGGEPRLMVKVAPPDIAKLQSSHATAPEVPATATASAPQASAAPPAEPAMVPSVAADSPAATPAAPAAADAPPQPATATSADASQDDALPGLVITVPK